MKRVIAILMIALTATACTRAVEVPREQFELAAQDKKNSHRISMNDGSRYAVDAFLLTDSTLTIAELNEADNRYKRVDLPIVLLRGDVKSIEKFEVDPDKTLLVVVPIGLALFLVIGFLTSPPAFD